MTVETAPSPAEDPFVEEARRHGARYRSFASAAREFCRDQADTGCPTCIALIEAFDLELARAFINGTGPFA